MYKPSESPPYREIFEGRQRRVATGYGNLEGAITDIPGYFEGVNRDIPDILVVYPAYPRYSGLMPDGPGYFEGSSPDVPDVPGYYEAGIPDMP